MTIFQSSHGRRIFLARHGQSIANLNKQISGQLDIPLSTKGRDQSLWLKEVLQHENLSAIYTSSLNRAVETARPTAEHHNLRIQNMDGLKEMHFGILQGKTADETDRHVFGLWQDPARYKMTKNIEGAETFIDFERRVSNCLAGLMANSSGTILIVGHRNTNEVILANLLMLGSATELNINVKNKYVYEILCGAIPQVATIRLGGEHHGKKYAGFKHD